MLRKRRIGRRGVPRICWLKVNPRMKRGIWQPDRRYWERTKFEDGIIYVFFMVRRVMWKIKLDQVQILSYGYYSLQYTTKWLL
jgi:hypothetical protein